MSFVGRATRSVGVTLLKIVGVGVVIVVNFRSRSVVDFASKTVAVDRTEHRSRLFVVP